MRENSSNVLDQNGVCGVIICFIVMKRLQIFSRSCKFLPLSILCLRDTKTQRKRQKKRKTEKKTMRCVYERMRVRGRERGKKRERDKERKKERERAIVE